MKSFNRQDAVNQERQTIRDAMDRLLAGKPVRSDGKLTVKSLAAEAGLKRWILTHRHTDLQTEFRDRVSKQDETPEAFRSIVAQNTDLTRQIEQLSARVKASEFKSHRLARVVQALVLENEQLRSELASKPSNVRPIRKR